MNINYNTKVQGSTLIEVTVVIAITGVLFMLATWAFLNFKQYLTAYSTEEQKNTTLRTFTNAFYGDLRNYQTMETQPNLIHFHDKHSRQKVNYHFYADGVVREHGIYKDTFRFTINDIKLKTLDKEKKKIKEVQINVQLNKAAIPLIFLKNYTPRDKYYIEHEH